MDTPQGGSVTRLIGGLKAGQDDSAAQLWHAYFNRLVRLAHGKLQGLPRRAADEEDVALSAFASFCRGAEAGRYPDLQDRENLWRLLMTITASKAARRQRHELQQKRDVSRLLDETALKNQSDHEMDLDSLIGKEPTPEFAAQIAEEYERLLGRLDSDELRQVAVLKMEGFTDPEIAGRMACAPRTVGRRLMLIRETWTRAMSIS